MDASSYLPTSSVPGERERKGNLRTCGDVEGQGVQMAVELRNYTFYIYDHPIRATKLRSDSCFFPHSVGRRTNYHTGILLHLFLICELNSLCMTTNKRSLSSLTELSFGRVYPESIYNLFPLVSIQHDSSLYKIYGFNGYH